MFSYMKPRIFRGPVSVIYRYFIKYDEHILNRQRFLQSVCCASEKSGRGYVGHQPIVDVNPYGSDGEGENARFEDVKAIKRRSAQLKLIYEAIVNDRNMTEEEIMGFRENVLSVGNVISHTNIDAVTIGICASLKNIGFADRYLNCLKQRDIEINVATLGKYMKLCYACGEGTDESKVMSVYFNLMKKLPLMDATTAENIIHGLSVTSEWKRGLDLMSMVKETSTPSSSTYSSLIVAAFRNRDVEIGWNLMEECIKVEKTPSDMVYLVWLSGYCTRETNSDVNEYLEMTERLLKFLSSHELTVSKVVSQKLQDTFGKLNWQCRFTPINERGICMNCRGEMLPIYISKSEFQRLSRAFLEKVMVGPDVFSNSSPDEVKAFQELIAKEAPFNTVIDGLNVAYSSGASDGRGNPAAVLKSVVAHFVDLSHKILVLGRTHMKSWSRMEMEYVRKNSQLFLAENLSQDDPFLLYAALSSGPGTCFLSRDLMRGHAYRLKCAEPGLGDVFRHWQMSHQMRLLGLSRNNLVNIKLPLEFSPKVQQVNGCWHVPIEEDDSSGDDRGGKKAVVPRSFLDPPKRWLCISRRHSARKSIRKNSHGECAGHSYW